MILEREGGDINALALVDYKTSLNHENSYDLQLQIYASAGRREGLDVVGAYVHDLSAADRKAVDVGEGALRNAEERALEAVGRYRASNFTPSPSHVNCSGCDMRAICRYRAS